MLMSSRVISALPRAVTSRSLTPSITSASTVVRSVSAAVCADAVDAAAAAASANASVAKRKGMEPENFFLGVRIFNDTRRRTARRSAGLGCGAVEQGTARRALQLHPSFRRYWRAALADGRSYIVMDAPPDREDCRPFVRVAGMLHEAGVNAPRVLAQDLGQGFLLLTDLGTRTYLEELNPNNAARLFGDAADALLRWQLATRPGTLPPYDQALLRREMNLFPEWYVGKHLQKALSPSQGEALETIFR